MARAPLSQLDDWELEHKEQDVRGETLYSEDGRPLGTIEEMIVNKDAEKVDAVRLDTGAEYPANAYEQRDGRVYLTTGARTQARGMAAGRTGERQEQQAIPLVEERLRVRKRSGQIGEVQVKTHVETEQKTVQVPLMREEAVVERREVEPRPADQPIEPRDQTIRVPLMGEEAVVEKEAVVTGEVVVGKRATQEVEDVSGTVRRTEVDVDREGTAKAHNEKGPRNR